MIETDFIIGALNDFAATWSATQINHLANFDVPHNLLGRRQNILKGDINEQWARWFTESLLDPRRILQGNLTYPFIYQDVFNAVDHMFHTTKTKTEKKQIASVTAKIIQKLAIAMSANRKRKSITREERFFLLDISGSPPRCWICGGRFSEFAIEKFLFNRQGDISLPPFIDVLKPKGLAERDLTIEIDHIVPFSKGGGDNDNLALTCGWCNRHKNANMSIYEVEGQPRLAGKNGIGITSLPQPFWIVRLLALVRQCEEPDGCERSTKNTEMTVVPIRKGGALNPNNLRVTCKDHDPFRERLQPPNIVKKIWNASFS